jgi:MFS family permease
MWMTNGHAAPLQALVKIFWADCHDFESVVSRGEGLGTLDDVTVLKAGGGVVADCVSRTRLMVFADVIGAGAYVGLAAMTLTRHVPLTLFCLLAVAAGTATALFSPAMDGVVPLVVSAEQLQQANGLLRVGTNSSLLVGLALSGVTVAAVGAGWALALNAASFVASAILAWQLKVLGRARRGSSGWADLCEGWRRTSPRRFSAPGRGLVRSAGAGGRAGRGDAVPR